MNQLYEAMASAVLDGDETAAEALARQALGEGLDLKEVMDQGFLKGIREAGLFKRERFIHSPQAADIEVEFPAGWDVS